MIHNIIIEMFQGNFSFLILVVGILQWIEMRKKMRVTEEKFLETILSENNGLYVNIWRRISK